MGRNGVIQAGCRRRKEREALALMHGTTTRLTIGVPILLLVSLTSCIVFSLQIPPRKTEGES